MDIYHKILRQYWGYESFRPLQESIMHSVCEGKDTLGLMPTGGGKSLTFQVPAMAMEGLCLVVTPLIALMKDQVDNLKQRGIKALAIYSGMTQNEIQITLDNAILGDYKFLYVSPERLGTDLFKLKLRNMHICLLVVDEAHCISQWGYDFRPSYMSVANVRELFPLVPVLALTATATAEVVNDIQQNLGFRAKNVFQKSFERENLSYSIYETENKMGALIKIITKIQGSALVYVRSRMKTKEIATELFQAGFSADYYHAGLSSDDKTHKQTAWKKNECRIIVATNAFGMGIDKPDVRLVVHMDLPNSPEEYFQEAGRGGRDEQKAHAVILYTKNDSSKLKKRISDEFPEKEFILKVYETLAYFLQVAEGFGQGSVYDFSLQKFCHTYKLPLLPAHNALKILDLGGYIEYTEEIENRSRITFTIFRDELYQYKFDEDYDLLINTVLRLYTGIFTDYAYIDENAIAIRINKTRHEVYEMLKLLSKRGVIDYIPHKKTPFIIYKQPRIATKYLSISKMVYEDRKSRFKSRISAMTDYVEKKDVCRSRILLTYFGQTNTKNCGQCDVCVAAQRKELSNNEFKEISDKILFILSDKTINATELIELLSNDFLSANVTKVLRFMMDRGTVVLEMDKLKLR